MTIVYHGVQPPLFAHSKVCGACHQEKPLEQFPRDASKKDGYYSLCKNCKVVQSQKSRQTHPAKRNQYENARYANDPQHRVRVLERVQRSRAKRADKERDYTRNWRKAHPHKATEQAMRRHARKRMATVENVDYDAIRERDGMWCYICEQDILPHHETQFDHVIPITRGGIHAASNIKFTHRCCNARKNSNLLEEMTTFQRRGPDN